MQNAHETGQDNQVGLRGINRTRQRSIEIFAHVVVAVIDNAGCDAGCARERYAAGVGTVADDLRHCARDMAAACVCDQRSEIRAAARDQDRDARERHQ